MSLALSPHVGGSFFHAPWACDQLLCAILLGSQRSFYTRGYVLAVEAVMKCSGANDGACDQQHSVMIQQEHFFALADHEGRLWAGR